MSFTPKNKKAGDSTQYDENNCWNVNLNNGNMNWNNRNDNNRVRAVSASRKRESERRTGLW